MNSANEESNSDLEDKNDKNADSSSNNENLDQGNENDDKFNDKNNLNSRKELDDQNKSTKNEDYQNDHDSSKDNDLDQNETEKRDEIKENNLEQIDRIDKNDESFNLEKVNELCSKNLNKIDDENKTVNYNESINVTINKLDNKEMINQESNKELKEQLSKGICEIELSNRESTELSNELSEKETIEQSNESKEFENGYLLANIEITNNDHEIDLHKAKKIKNVEKLIEFSAISDYNQLNKLDESKESELDKNNLDESIEQKESESKESKESKELKESKVSTNSNNEKETKRDEDSSTILESGVMYYNEQPIVNKINSTVTVAVNRQMISAESFSLLHKKYNRTNNDQNDEDPAKLDRQAKDVLNFNKFNLLNNDLNLNSHLNRNKNQDNLFKFDNLGYLNLVSALSNTNAITASQSSIRNSSIFITNNNNQNNSNNNKIQSEVIINYCEKISPSSLLINTKFVKNRKSTNLLNNSYNDVPFNSFNNLINHKENDCNQVDFVDIVKKINLPTSQTKPECIELADEEDEDEIEEKNGNDKVRKEIVDKTNKKSNEKETINYQNNQIVDEKYRDSTITISNDTKNQETSLDYQQKSSVIDSTTIEEKMSTTIISPSKKNDLFDDLDKLTNSSSTNTSSISKMDSSNSSFNLVNKPLKGLLKKAKSSDSQDSSTSNGSKKKRRVKFAETMMVFCDDWPEELMPQIIPITFKSSNEFNLVELAAQSYMNSYMFEPPAEYKDLDLDFLPFDPPPDYRDCINSAACSNSLANQEINFSNIPNHALLQMYENGDLNDNLLNKLDFDEDMLMKFSYANAASIGDQRDIYDLIKENQLEENDEQLDAYKNIILNNSNELLEEDDIIGVLKEDSLLQAIGSQIDSLDKNKDNNESNDDETICDSDTNELNDPNLNNLNSQEIVDCADDNKDAGTVNQPGIIILNKNTNCQPIQIITSNENADLSFSNNMDDLASDSSINSQDTIIMMTNAILTDKTSHQNQLTVDNQKELQMKRQRLKASEFENARFREESISKDSGITMDGSDNQDSLKENLKNDLNKQDENNNQENQEQVIKSSNQNEKINQLVQKYSQSKSTNQQDAQSMNNNKVEKSGTISVSELR